MPPAPVVVVAMAAVVLYATGAGVVHVVKKVGHTAKTVVVRVVKGKAKK